MQNWLVAPTKKRVIQEVRKILYDHPRYREHSQNVYNKFGMSERPNRGVIVNAASADRVQLSADNYIGLLKSFVMLTKVGNSPNTTLEWVRENNFLLEQYSPKRAVFPSPPGVYLFRVTDLPEQSSRTPGRFEVEPVLTVKDEHLLVFGSSADSEAQLSRENIYPGSVRLWLDGRRPLLAGRDYSMNDATGEIRFLRPTPTGMFVVADYRYRVPVQEHLPFFLDTADTTSIPGAVLAFGDRAQLDDRFAVVVGDGRADVAEIHGGKFETNLELVVFVQNDSEERERMSDYIVAKFLERQSALGFEGLELMNISPGSESEEVYNQTSDDYYYESPISLSLRVDWQTFSSLPVEVFRVETTSAESEAETGYLDGTSQSDLVAPGTNADTIGQSVVIGRGLGFERV